ncbi:PVC-type heme-binding CxxCH protein [Tautonia sociabilis]|uniref:C-type cytochrome n=1 Tax=Tautonia sociabilis TaxID=2080755 RepID=A0A432MHZ8_9BACT|nr:PVC-type heme-binding CxxCH protein [Tautonia sociabilis]RUL86762.1 c-type cytochrome [Tautonia sociabilis]
MRSKTLPLAVAIASILLVAIRPSPAQQDAPIPHGQDRPPNPARSPEEAVAAMTVPDGFTVEVVAAEPDLVNPVAMTFDEKGRIWVTESLEYPRRSPGPGQDRVKVLEDTDGDGRADQFTVFADGLNIPSGVAVGHGGVWVANSPDILFYPNADGDLSPDGPPEVVVTGFGRADTHELPNSLTWGPDGWLYGWNGVFNPSRVEQDGRVYEFTCAIFRIHPITRRFELFCEGTSNPWGIAIDPEGSLFASACVIDHLWHLVETGSYHRQGGPYPPFTWKIESIVDHVHQKRAYCGITYFDSAAYPPEYRDRLYMGNIHGNCINVDSLSRDGASYRGHGEPDFLSANDAWFMPVVQKTGPDGCLYVLDWYDRYHCYQDANRDPAGIDRLKGRLYRVRYRETPRRCGFDLGKASDDALVALLRSPNVYDREIAQRVLTERLMAGGHDPLRARLEAIVASDGFGRKARMHALWVLVSSGPLDPKFHLALLSDEDPTIRAWGVRASGNMGAVDDSIRTRVIALARDPSPDVRLQVAIASRKVAGLDGMATLLDVLGSSGPDPVLPKVVWRNLHPMLDRPEAVSRLGDLLLAADRRWSPELAAILPRVLDRVSAVEGLAAAAVADLARIVIEHGEVDDSSRRAALASIADQVREGRLGGDRLQAIRSALGPIAGRVLADADHPLRPSFARLAALWGDPAARAAVRERFVDPSAAEDERRASLDALIASAGPDAIAAISAVLADPDAGSAPFRGEVLAALGRLDSPRVAEVVLTVYDRLEPETKPRAIALLTQRPSWSKDLLAAIARGEVPGNALNVTQVRTLLQSPDEELAALVRSAWGTVREGRDPAREQVIDRLRDYLDDARGNPVAGRAVFDRVCAQCHQIYGEGQQVGPDLTGNGRGSYEQLLSNLLDPNLVIGASYQGTIVATADGRILTGLLEEDSDDRIVLRLQGGEREVIPRDQIEESRVSPVSLMPENLEEQVTPAELADLIAFLCLDRPPEDPQARPIAGTPAGLIGPRPREGSNE